MTYITKAENILVSDLSGLFVSENAESVLTEIATDLSSHADNVIKHNNFAVATGENTYAVTLSPAPTSYTAGMVVSFKATSANTGAVTLNCNELGSKPIYKNVIEQLENGDILLDQIITVIYDGTNFQIVSGSGGSGKAITFPSYSRTTLSTSSAYASINIPFDYTKDILHVYQNSTYIAPNEDYTISGTNIIKTDGTWSAGTVFDFIVVQSITTDAETVIGTARVSSSFTATYDGTINCPIGTVNYTYGIDVLNVYYQNLLLFENVNYTINNNHISIDLLDFTINTGETIRFEIYRNFNNNIAAEGPQMLGSKPIKAVFYNSSVIDENLTLSQGLNALSAGPIRIEEGSTVTIGENCRWVIV